MTKGFLKDMLKYLPAQVVPGLVGLVSIPIVTRLFPPADYGNYSLATASVMILSTLFGWLPTAVIRYYPAYERQGRLAVFNATIVRLAVVTLAGLILAYYVPLLVLRTRIPAGLWRLLLVGGGLFVVTSLFNLLQYFLRSQRRVGRFSAFAVWYSVIGFGLGIALVVLLNVGIEGLLIGATLSVVLVLPLLWRQALGRERIRLVGAMDSPTARAVFAYGAPLVVSNLAVWILSLSDRYVIGLFRDTAEVGVYSLSYNVADKSLMLLVSLFLLAWGPIGMRIWETQGEPESRRFVTEATRLYLLLSVPLVVGLSVLSRLVVAIMAGDEYERGYRIMPYVLSGVVLLGLEQRYQSGLLFHKRTSLITLSATAAGVLNLFLNILFIPTYGYVAAAVTTLVSYVAHVSLTRWFSRRFFVWEFPRRSLFNVLVASGVMGGLVHILADTIEWPPIVVLLLCAGLGSVIYAVALLALGEFSRQELAKVHSATRQALARLRRARRMPAVVEDSGTKEAA
jgi:O-antigen/teichoic acid export membrane protein